tara:strand:+ start:156 stop:314 length:159 start_codon:yes stop_codon:yes gene_type:complete
VGNEELIDELVKALLCVEADIEGYIELGLVDDTDPVRETLTDIRKVLAKVGQ